MGSIIDKIDKPCKIQNLNLIASIKCTTQVATFQGTKATA